MTASPVTGMPSRNLPISVFGGMRQRFEPRQAEEAAGPFDGVDEAEDVVEDLGVVRLLLEANELHVDDIEAFVRLGEKLPQQVVHGTGLSTPGTPVGRRLSGASASVLRNGLRLVAANRPSSVLVNSRISWSCAAGMSAGIAS